MKYLVSFLVLVNVTYLGWNIYLSRTAGDDLQARLALPAGVVSLVTLEELEQQREQAKELSDVETLTASRPPGAGAALGCKAIGPFLAVNELQAVAEELRRQGWQVQEREEETQKPDGFWVYLPAMERDQALQVVKTLEENRDQEYYVGKGNFVALGTFKEMSRAEMRVEQVHKFGFDPVVEERYASSTEYWLDIGAQSPAARDPDAIIQDRPGLNLQAATCP